MATSICCHLTQHSYYDNLVTTYISQRNYFNITGPPVTAHQFYQFYDFLSHCFTYTVHAVKQINYATLWTTKDISIASSVQMSIASSVQKSIASSL